MADKIEELTSEYVLELLHTAFYQENFFQVLALHLQYNFLVTEQEKKLWKKALQLYHLNNKVPSLGVIQVELRKDEKVKDLIVQIKALEDIDHMQVIDSFEEFIKENRYVEIFEKSGELYNKGEQKAAYDIFIEGAERIGNFTIKDKIYNKVFANFTERNNERILAVDDIDKKTPFGIDKLDEACLGGPEAGDTVLLMAESGIGKSQFLYHYGITTARRGGDVAIYQIEGTEKQVMDRLDSAWTGTLYHEMKTGQINDEKYKKLKVISQRIRGEIFVEAFEKFGGVTFFEIRKSAITLKKMNPNLKLILIDYLELMEVGDGIQYGPSTERHKQQKLGRLLKELAMELKVVVATVTQASNLPSELKKDPTFVMTREYLAEDKGKIRPFDYFFTLNQSYDEMKLRDKNNVRTPIIRIYTDKIREHASGLVVKIVTNFSRARFYDKKKTLAMVVDYDEDEDE